MMSVLIGDSAVCFFDYLKPGSMLELNGLNIKDPSFDYLIRP
jgi:hypothetical protein